MQHSVAAEMGAQVRIAGDVAYAVRALRGYFALNLPVSDTVRRDFRLDLASALLFGVFGGSALGYIYVVARTIGVSQFGISFLASMGAAGCVLSLPASMIVKSCHGRMVLLASLGLGRGILLPLLFLSGPAPYIIAISIFFVAGGVSSPFYAEIMQHVYPREFRGQLMSLVRIGSGTVMTLSSLLTAWLMGSGIVSYQLLFGVGSILALASLYVFAKITPVRPAPRPRVSLADTLGILWRNRPFAHYQLWVFVMASGAIMANTLYPLVIVDKLHAGYGPFGVLSVITSIGYLASWFVWGRVIDRLGPVFTMLVVGACGLLFPASMLVAPGAYWLVFSLFAIGAANAGFEIGPVAAVIHYARATPAEVPVYMGLHSILIGVRGIAFPFVATFVLHGQHYTLALGTALAISSVGTYMLWRTYLQERHAPEDPD